MTNFKARVQDAIRRNHERELKSKAPKPKRHNDDPEAQVVRTIITETKLLDWDIQVVESKAKFIDGQYRSSGIKFGTCDILGIDSIGNAVFIEAKAPGKRSTFWREGNDRQIEFLLSKIERGAFACVVDSWAQLNAYYMQWRQIRITNTEAAKAFLTDALPPKPKRKVDTTPLFDAD